MKISNIFSALHKDGSCVKVTVLRASTLETSACYLQLTFFFIFPLLDDLQENFANMTHIHMIVVDHCFVKPNLKCVFIEWESYFFTFKQLVT